MIKSILNGIGVGIRTIGEVYTGICDVFDIPDWTPFVITATVIGTIFGIPKLVEHFKKDK